jgi:histidyl-tRNA synthetase
MNQEKTVAVTYRGPRGTRDILPEEVGLWRHLEETARAVFTRAGYGETRTPIFEDTELFVRSTGEDTDIVEKEMYTLERADGTSITLRPEGTPSIARAYIEHDLAKQAPFRKFFYVGPMFRYERPQAGRSRQFHQAGVEAFGSESPLLDVETIDLAAQFFDAIGLTGYEIRINSIGCAGCRGDFRQLLRARLEGRRSQLCENCRRRFERNVFRILDCKEEACSGIIMTLPVVADHLCPACAEHWRQVQAGLKALGRPYLHDPHLVRGLDYYTRTVYEFVHGGLGARNAVCGGGRYDNLIGELGGSPVGGIGFAVGFEPTVAALSADARERATKAGSPPGLDAYVVRASDGARLAALQLAHELRQAGFACDLDYEGRSLKAQMRSANRLQARFALILGEDEVAGDTVTVRDMASASQESVPRAGLIEWLRRRSAPRSGSPG